MKAVILAGGYGTRIAEETHLKPKPMVEIGAKITAFEEKPQGDASWVNGGFFVLSPKTIDYIDGDETVWEREPMERLASEGDLSAFLHRGFWQPLDTLRDKNLLNDLWDAG